MKPDQCSGRNGGPHVTAPLDRQCINCQAWLVARDGKWQAVEVDELARKVRS